MPPFDATVRVRDRGLHSSTFQLNLSGFCHCQTDATQHIPLKVLMFIC